MTAFEPTAKGFRLLMTPEWWDLPLDPATRVAEIEALVAKRRTDATPELRRTMVNLLAQAAEAAYEIGAELCAEYGEADEQGNLLSANLMVVEVPMSLEPDEMGGCVAAMASSESSKPGASPPTECSVVHLREVGRAIRMRTDPLPENPDGPEVLRSLRLQFFVPIPGAPTTALLTFSAPVVTGHEPHELLIELFDAMAETFCFLDQDGEPLTPAFAQPSQP